MLLNGYLIDNYLVGSIWMSWRFASIQKNLLYTSLGQTYVIHTFIDKTVSRWRFIAHIAREYPHLSCKLIITIVNQLPVIIKYWKCYTIVLAGFVMVVMIYVEWWVVKWAVVYVPGSALARVVAFKQINQRASSMKTLHDWGAIYNCSRRSLRRASA